MGIGSAILLFGAGVAFGIVVVGSVFLAAVDQILKRLIVIAEEVRA